MSDRGIDVDLTTGTETRIDQVPSDSERKAYSARLAQVLDRTLTVDRLNVNLPSDLSSYWCPRDPLSIAQAELRGFKIDTEFATRNALNDSADGQAIIADVVHMVRPKWMKEEEDKIIRQRYVSNHLQDRRRLKEEKDFLTQNELPPIVNSNSETASGSQIEETLKKG